MKESERYGKGRGSEVIFGGIREEYGRQGMAMVEIYVRDMGVRDEPGGRWMRVYMDERGRVSERVGGEDRFCDMKGMREGKGWALRNIRKKRDNGKLKKDRIIEGLWAGGKGFYDVKGT